MKDNEATSDRDEFLEDSIEQMLASPGEEVLFAVRKHIFTTLVSILGTIFFTLFLSVFGWAILIFLHVPVMLIVSVQLLFLDIVLFICTKIAVEWFFHVYAITNQRILELFYKPLSSEFLNHVLLDQVRCTEITARENGIVNHYLDMGDVVICFDMPTHEDEIIFYGIASPHKAAHRIGDIFHSANVITSQGAPARRRLWYRNKANGDMQRPFDKSKFIGGG